LIGFGGVTYSIYSIYCLNNKYQESASKYDDIRKIYQKSTQTSSQKNIKNHNELLNINEDYVGWIDISGTSINYPIVKGEDNEFYLKHNFYREKDFSGAIFMDYRNSLEDFDRNTIIYGHNMKDKSMFSILSSYLDKSFYEKHTSLTMEIPHESTFKWEIFSAYKTKNVDWMKTSFESEDEFASFLDSITKNSIFHSKTKFEEGDIILTLSTCTENNNDERMVIHAKLNK
jgi:sortase B